MKPLIFTFSLFSVLTQLSPAQNNTPNAFLGVHSNSVSVKKAEKLGFENPYGAYLTNVIGNSSAERAGLQAFDYIYQIGDYGFGAHDDVGDVLENFQPGNATTVQFIRNGEKMSQTVILGTKGETDNSKRTRAEDPFLGVEANHTALPTGMEGVRIDVVKNSTAKSIGIQDDDIIIKIDDYPIID